MAVGTITSLGIIFTYTRVMWWVTPDDLRNYHILWTPPYWTSFLWGFLIFIGDVTKSVAQNALKQTDPLSTKIQIIALGYQFFVLSAFTFTTFRFMMMSKTWAINFECDNKNWRQLGWTVVICAALITTRQVFLIVQVDARTDPMGFYSQHEWVYWVTESLPLFLIFALFSLTYPGFFLPREYIGFRIKLKEIAESKRDASWPLNISAPLPVQKSLIVETKDPEATVQEMKVGMRY
ncbi:uncharacterized protein PV09_00483 [Verruconis gallopava]|uniref:Uncharacterized protein n=1 Tax=Verruconis gallopava TaxID=253628 RepID=A0A0D1Y3W2_9PEZI|nr:uncharacterized protein PV09_00483 [Verruconis gallopava]KIW09616.1 hypothetical protein PV09_00483 [Verruconis gallopava]